MERSDMTKIAGNARQAYGDLSRAAGDKADMTQGAAETMADQASEYVRDARDKAVGAADRARGWATRNYGRVASHARANPWLYLGAGVVIGLGFFLLRGRSESSFEE